MCIGLQLLQYDTHTTSSGVLARIWPCGVVLLRELFITESKVQVYGHLHEFLQEHPDTAQKLSELSLAAYFFSPINLGGIELG